MPNLPARGLKPRDAATAEDIQAALRQLHAIYGESECEKSCPPRDPPASATEPLLKCMANARLNLFVCCKLGGNPDDCCGSYNDAIDTCLKIWGGGP